MNAYLDNAATTKVHPKVAEKMIPYLKEDFGNPSSTHSYGRKARVAVEESREIIAQFINADPGEIFFTGSGTEASNMIIRGIAHTERSESGRDSIISSAGDHKATIESAEELTKEGFRVKFLRLNNDFIIQEEDVQSLDMEKTSLVTLIHVNNETGSINDIEKLSKYFRNAYFHIDAVQSFGKISLNVENLGIDCFSASAHKIYGPKGIGFAYIRSQTPMSALILGGGQERNRRAGTENVAAIVGFAEAVKIAQENMNSNYDYVQGLNDYLWKGLNEAGISGLFRNSGINSSPYILSITFDPEIYSNDSEAMIMFMDLNGIAVSSGSACSSGTLKPSHVITAAGHSVDYARGTMRISFSPENTRPELDYAIEQIKKMADRNRK